MSSPSDAGPPSGKKQRLTVPTRPTSSTIGYSGSVGDPLRSTQCTTSAQLISHLFCAAEGNILDFFKSKKSVSEFTVDTPGGHYDRFQRGVFNALTSGKYTDREDKLHTACSDTNINPTVFLANVILEDLILSVHGKWTKHLKSDPQRASVYEYSLKFVNYFKANAVRKLILTHLGLIQPSYKEYPVITLFANLLECNTTTVCSANKNPPPQNVDTWEYFVVQRNEPVGQKSASNIAFLLAAKICKQYNEWSPETPQNILLAQSESALIRGDWDLNALVAFVRANLTLSGVDCSFLEDTVSMYDLMMSVKDENTCTRSIATSIGVNLDGLILDEHVIFRHDSGIGLCKWIKDWAAEKRTMDKNFFGTFLLVAGYLHKLSYLPPVLGGLSVWPACLEFADFFGINPANAAVMRDLGQCAKIMHPRAPVKLVCTRGDCVKFDWYGLSCVMPMSDPVELLNQLCIDTTETVLGCELNKLQHLKIPTVDRTALLCDKLHKMLGFDHRPSKFLHLTKGQWCLVHLLAYYHLFKFACHAVREAKLPIFDIRVIMDAGKSMRKRVWNMTGDAPSISETEKISKCNPYFDYHLTRHLRFSKLLLDRAVTRASMVVTISQDLGANSRSIELTKCQLEHPAILKFRIKGVKLMQMYYPLLRELSNDFLLLLLYRKSTLEDLIQNIRFKEDVDLTCLGRVLDVLTYEAVYFKDEPIAKLLLPAIVRIHDPTQNGFVTVRAFGEAVCEQTLNRDSILWFSKRCDEAKKTSFLTCIHLWSSKMNRHRGDNDVHKITTQVMGVFARMMDSYQAMGLRWDALP